MNLTANDNCLRLNPRHGQRSFPSRAQSKSPNRGYIVSANTVAFKGREGNCRACRNTASSVLRVCLAQSPAKQFAFCEGSKCHPLVRSGGLQKELERSIMGMDGNTSTYKIFGKDRKGLDRKNVSVTAVTTSL